MPLVPLALVCILGSIGMLRHGLRKREGLSAVQESHLPEVFPSIRKSLVMGSGVGYPLRSILMRQ